MPLRSINRSVRRFGLSQSIKWTLLVFAVYGGFLYLWKTDKIHSMNEDPVRGFIIIPKPRRFEYGEETANNTQIKQTLNTDEVDEKNDLTSDVIAVLVFCATRDMAIRNHLEQLLKQRPSAQKFPIYISQDSDSLAVTNTVLEFVNKSENVFYMHHDRERPKTASQRSAKSYFYIAQHYKWALSEVLEKHSTVLITEDDLDISNDFFNYFASTKKILDSDPTVFCISAWNDNGANTLVDRRRSDLLYRTDFFPGLGWMLKAETGKQLLNSWPDAYWDDWLRRPEIRKNRVCIRPEITRTAHNNRLAGKGASNGMYKSYLESIQLPDSAVDFSLVDTDRLLKSQYDPAFRQQLLDAKPITIQELLEGKDMSKEFAYRCTYSEPRQFRQIANKFKLMNDFRGGMVRTAYYGVISFMAHEARVYGVPEKLNLTRPFEEYESEDVYDLKWDLMNRYLDFQSAYCKSGKWTGTCDPKDPGMIAWFERKRQKKRLEAWGEMIVY